MNRQRTTLPLCLAGLILASCGQFRDHSKSSTDGGAVALQEPEQDEPDSDTNREDGSSSYYGATRSRLQLIREDIELDDFDVDFDDGSAGLLMGLERDRTGFRAGFGRVASGGFVQLFTEKVSAPSLLIEEFTNYGIGGGIDGSPVLGRTRNIEFLVPFKFEVNVSVGSKNASVFDQNLLYAEGKFELGFGASWLGLQSTTGIMVNSLAGLFDTGSLSSAALGGGAEISGSNVGAYFEVLYKHPDVPLMARARAIAGDIQGIILSLGFAF